MRFSTEIKIGVSIDANGEATGGKPAIISIPPSRAQGKANSVYVPVGPSHSEAYFVLLKSDLDTLELNEALNISWKQVAVRSNNAPDKENSKTLVFRDLYLISAERLLQGGADDGDSLYLAHFVDARYLVATNSGTSARRVNLRSFANSNDYLSGTTTSGTWPLLMENLWNRLNIMGDFPGLPDDLAFDSVPEDYNVTGANCWQSICSLLNAWDCAVSHNILTGEYSIVQLGANQEIEENEDGLKQDTQPIQNNVECAANLYIYFRTHRKAFGQERHTEYSSNWVYNGTHIIVTAETEIDGAISSSHIWTDMPVVIDENSTITNLSAIATRAERIKDGYVLRHTTPNLHKIYRGLYDYQTGALIRAVLWRNYDDGNGTQTEIVGGADIPAGRMGNGVGLSITAINPRIVLPANEQLAPPDLGRHSYPNYPHIVNVVQITSSSGSYSYGATSTPTAAGFHYGRVRRWVNNSMGTMDRCWIRFIDDHDLLNGQVTGVQGQFYGPAMLSGISTANSLTLPVYLVTKGCCDSTGSGQSGSEPTDSGSQTTGSGEAGLDGCCGEWYESSLDMPATLYLRIFNSYATALDSLVIELNREFIPTAPLSAYYATTIGANNFVDPVSGRSVCLEATLQCGTPQPPFGIVDNNFVLTTNPYDGLHSTHSGGGLVFYPSPFAQPQPGINTVYLGSTTLLDCLPMTLQGTGGTRPSARIGTIGPTFLGTGSFTWTIGET